MGAALSETRLQGGVAFWSAPRVFYFRSGKTCFRCPYGPLPGSMAKRPPLRVLCLAGFRQSERGFREKTGALRKALRGRAELVCLSGPHPVTDAEGPEGGGPDSGEPCSAPEMPSQGLAWSS